ncbi:hypothetical protein [Carboxydothermus pertinax]|uniref:Uncharacterized protein n=1 Tax=Carboxydothermus pertinax TaxID=870242 RepID=A0A1L8CXP6_9THEO|nr:hypothetical protein [Carboxydothermus pertinax]GAV23651.1 hypothetical protein cpu_21610 [Carboxydothermus pertinax]
MKKSDKLKTLRTRLLDNWLYAGKEERLNLLVKIMDIEEEMGMSYISQKKKQTDVARKVRAI